MLISFFLKIDSIQMNLFVLINLLSFCLLMTLNLQQQNIIYSHGDKTKAIHSCNLKSAMIGTSFQ